MIRAYRGFPSSSCWQLAPPLPPPLLAICAGLPSLPTTSYRSLQATGVGCDCWIWLHNRWLPTGRPCPLGWGSAIGLWAEGVLAYFCGAITGQWQAPQSLTNCIAPALADLALVHVIAWLSGRLSRWSFCCSVIRLICIICFYYYR